MLKENLKLTLSEVQSSSIMSCLQLKQNFAACILTDTKKYDDITPALEALGWLTIEEQLRLRDVTMMYKCVNNLVPAYINCEIGKRSTSHVYSLRSSEDLNLPNAGQRLPGSKSVEYSQ